MPIEVNCLSFSYELPDGRRIKALDEISFRISDGEAVGIIGATGSGKTTLIQHLAALLKPSSGTVKIDGIDTGARRINRKEMCRIVGLVFQYPESQLFEETVFDDIAFGPRNLGLDEAEVRDRVKESIGALGIPDHLLARSPFSLSGGQMRRVAIAGVLSMRPRILVLDEPTAGLDPSGREDLLSRLNSLRRDRSMTLVIASHNMEDVTRLVERVFVLGQGRLVFDGSVKQAFSSFDLEEYGIKSPPVVEVMRKIKDIKGWCRTDVFDVGEAADEILTMFGGNLLGQVNSDRTVRARQLRDS